MSDLSAISEAAIAAQARDDKLHDVDTFSDWLYGECAGIMPVFRHTYWRAPEFAIGKQPELARAMKPEELLALVLLTDNHATLKTCRDELVRKYLESAQ